MADMTNRPGKYARPKTGRGAPRALRSIVAGLALAAAATIAGTTSAWAYADEDAVTVDMNDRLRYEPAEIVISVGDTVEWRNVGLIRHTVTGRRGIPEEFDSGWIADGETFRRTFTKPGTYAYYCRPHERAGMIGKIIVR